jgi:hypothetical protein
MKIHLEHIANQLKQARGFVYGIPKKNTYAIPNTPTLELNSTLDKDPNKKKAALGIITSFNVEVVGNKILVNNIKMEVKRTGWAQIMLFMNEAGEILTETHVDGYKLGILGYDSETYTPYEIITDGPELLNGNTASAEFYINLSFN